MINYKEKIRKLLALASSPNENEAKCALLKAKQLMAEHKIEEIDLEEIKAKKVKRILTDYTYSRRGEWWMYELADIIAGNYCCSCAYSQYSGTQKRGIVFVGLEDDVDLCALIFGYAVDSARELSKAHCKKVSKHYPYGLSAAEKTTIKNSFVKGFSAGVKEAFKEQQEKATADESQWGLVMVMPKEVSDYCKSNFKTSRDRAKAHSIDEESRASGFHEGKKFNPNKRIS